MKPTRQFTADEGNYSTGLSGPDTIEKDLDIINLMFDPDRLHEDGSKGGIQEENLSHEFVAKINGTLSNSTYAAEAASLASDKSIEAVNVANNAIGIVNTAVSVANNAIDIATYAKDKADEVFVLKPNLEKGITDVQDAIVNMESMIDGAIFTSVGASTMTGVFEATEDNAKTFNIPVSIYSPNYDYLALEYKGISLTDGENYTRYNRGITLSFELKIGEKIHYRITKNAMIDPTLSDGGLLKDGTVSEIKLSPEVIEKLNDLSPLINHIEGDTEHVYHDRQTTAKYKFVVVDGEPFLEVVEI